MPRRTPSHTRRPARPPLPDESELALSADRIPAGVDAKQVIAARLQVRRDLEAAQERLDELIAFSAGPTPFAYGRTEPRSDAIRSDAMSPEAARRLEQAAERCLTLSELLQGPGEGARRAGDHLLHEARLLLRREST